jgi:anti-sigma-K factor RskA
MAEIDEIDDIDGLAAEYVLGTLSMAERADVDRRLRREPGLGIAIANWELRLDPLLGAIRPVAPPTDAFAAIRAKIGTTDAAQPSKLSGTTEIVDLQRRLRRWQGGAIAAAAMAASLLVFVAMRETAPIRDETFVAVLEGDDRNPAFVAAVSTKDRSIMVLRVGEPLAAAPGHSHELWAVGGDSPAPRSLGLLSAASRFPADKLGGFDAAGLQRTTFAISVEPEGGSPTGQPTGPVVFTGKLVPVPGK